MGWNPVDGGGVTTWNTRAGAVVPEVGDYSVAQVTGAAPLAGPVFTGDPTAPTPAAGDSDTSIATTAFVAAAQLPAYRIKAGLGPTVSGMGLQTYVSVTTPVLAAGTYSVLWSGAFSCTATGGVPGIQVTLAATQVPDGVIAGHSSSSNGAKQTITAADEYVHAGGTIALLVAVRRAAGTGNVIPQSFSLSMRRAV